MKHFLYLIFVFLLLGCTNKSEEETSTSSSETQKSGEYEDGTYCALVTYYNPNTGTRRTYTLNVDVENNELVRINWNNGGWLDDSHFSPETLDEDGSCSYTSDKGYKYDIEITGPKCTLTDVIRVEENHKQQVYTLTLNQCASALQMSESELAEYEQTFSVNLSLIHI